MEVYQSHGIGEAEKAETHRIQQAEKTKPKFSISTDTQFLAFPFWSFLVKKCQWVKQHTQAHYSTQESSQQPIHCNNGRLPSLKEKAEYLCLQSLVRQQAELPQISLNYCWLPIKTNSWWPASNKKGHLHQQTLGRQQEQLPQISLNYC